MEQDKERHDSKPQQSRQTKWQGVTLKMIEGAATTGASLILLAIIGYSYTKYYNRMVLLDIETAFQNGEPVLELAAGIEEPPEDAGNDERQYYRWIPRMEQDRIDRIVSGRDSGRYYLIMGEKGTGKSSMLIDAMAKIDANGVVMMEAHANLEIFRIRLGQCLQFSFHEDNIGALFSIRGPRSASAILDIERAFNKLEKVALIRRNKGERPLVLIINQAHLIRDDKEGQDLIELIQQRAEQWAAAELATVVINSDKYWIYEQLRQYSTTRLEVIQVTDLPKGLAMQALREYRWKWYGERLSEVLLEEIYDRIGGRLAFLSRVAKSHDMIKVCEQIRSMEKSWFLHECGILGQDMDDDVMDQQKYAAST